MNDRPKCETCQKEENLTIYLHHAHGCLRCAAKKQKRVYVPFEDFMDKYFEKYNQELPLMVEWAKLSEEQFNKAIIYGKMPADFEEM